MEDRIKSSLDTHRNLLELNMIMTDEFYNRLVKHDVMTSTMVEDIQDCATREDANKKLVDLLFLRGHQSVTNFVNVLIETGHVFLGQHLQDELDGTLKQFRVTSKDVAENLPFVQTLTSEDRKKLTKYLDTKISENVLLATFTSGSMEKQKVLLTKTQCQEQIAEMRQQLMEKEEQITNLSHRLVEAMNENESLTQRNASLNQEVLKQNKHFDKELSTQRSFAMAGNSEISRMQERLSTFDSQVRSMNVKARCFLKPDEAEEIKNDPDNIRVSLLEKNFNKIMQRLNELGVIRENMRKDMKEQAKSLLEIMNVHESNKKPEQELRAYIQNEYECISRAVRQSVSLGKNIHSILNDVTLKSPEIQREHTTNFQFENTKEKEGDDALTNDFAHLHKKLNLMYSDVDHLKSEWRGKEQQVLALQQENEQLRIELKVLQMQQQPLVDNRQMNYSHGQTIECKHGHGQSHPNYNHFDGHLSRNQLTPTHIRDVPEAEDTTGDKPIPVRASSAKSDHYLSHNISLPPITSTGSQKLNNTLNGTGEPVLHKHVRRSLDPLDSFRSPRPDSPDPRSLSQLSVRSENSKNSKKSHVQTVSFPRDWNKS